MKQLYVLAVALVLLLTGCVSNKAVIITEPSDYTLTCEQLKDELTDLGVVFESAKEDSGVTRRNVGLALVFWPGIIVNEMRANNNQESIQARIKHLSILYNQKCTQAEEQAEAEAE